MPRRSRNACVLASGGVGIDVARRLAAGDRFERVVVVDLGGGDRSDLPRIDVLARGAASRLRALFDELDPSLVVDAACSVAPTRPAEPWNFDGCRTDAWTEALKRRARPASSSLRVVLLSSTAVYRAAPGLPLLVGERRERRA